MQGMLGLYPAELRARTCRSARKGITSHVIVQSTTPRLRSETRPAAHSKSGGGNSSCRDRWIGKSPADAVGRGTFVEVDATPRSARWAGRGVISSAAGSSTACRFTIGLSHTPTGFLDRRSKHE